MNWNEIFWYVYHTSQDAARFFVDFFRNLISARAGYVKIIHSFVTFRWLWYFYRQGIALVDFYLIVFVGTLQISCPCTLVLNFFGLPLSNSLLHNCECHIFKTQPGPVAKNAPLEPLAGNRGQVSGRQWHRSKGSWPLHYIPRVASLILSREP